jgi:transposase
MQGETNAKQPINREAVHVLAQAIGARPAARSLGINEKTVLSWSHRGKWKLPQRKGGRPASRSQVSPSDVLAEFRRQGGLTRINMARAIAEAAEKLCG